MREFASLCIALFSATSSALSFPSLDKRQASSAIANSAFRRRGYHSSAVLDGWLYVDGGEFSYASGNNIVYQYSSTLLSIDLSQDWTNTSVPLRSNSKPADAPNLLNGGIWVDEANHLLYTGFAGRRSTFGDRANQDFGLWSFSPDGQGGGRWENLNATAATGFTEARPFQPLVASGNGRGYVLGGFAANTSSSDPRNGRWPVSGLVSYDFASNTLRNDTVTGIQNEGRIQMGGAHFVPNFGPQGILVTWGGDQVTDGADRFVASDVVQIYDPAAGSWYEQPTSGNIPGGRKEFCFTGAASNNETYEIFMYAGWGGNLGPRAIPYDEVFVLSLPSFNWFKADYLAENPRHALTCNHIGGGQIATIGGLNTTQNGPDNLYNDVFNTPDQFTQGLSVFDLNTMTWRPNYAAAQREYTPPAAIQQYYSTNSRTPTFVSTGLQDLMAVQNFTAPAVDAPNNPDPNAPGGNTPEDSGSGSSSNAGAIAGGVVGGVAAIAAVAFAAFFIMRRRKQRAAANAEQGGFASEMPGGQTAAKYEMADTSNAGAPMANNIVYAKHREPAPLVPQQQYEMPGNDTRRHELPS